jgi:hypothetical protein
MADTTVSSTRNLGSAKQARKIAGLKTNAPLQNWVRQGRIRAVRVGRRVAPVRPTPGVNYD